MKNLLEYIWEASEYDMRLFLDKWNFQNYSIIILYTNNDEMTCGDDDDEKFNILFEKHFLVRFMSCIRRI